MKFFIQLVIFLSFSTLAIGQSQFSIYFDSNKYELTSLESNKLNQWISSNPKVKIVGIHGFCDEDGTSSFNDTLAKNRINFVYTSLKIKLRFELILKRETLGNYILYPK